MSVITISGTTGGTPPLSVYLCDEYGNNCYLTSTTGGTYTLNSFYSSANTLMVKTIDSTGCEYFELVSCYDPPPTPTPTPTPTCGPSTVHPYYTPFGSSTNITGYFYTSFLSACTAFNCVTGGTCAVNAAFLAYLDESEPQIGSILYSNNVGCSPTLLTGYFLVKIGGSPTYNAIAEVTAGVVTDLPSCP